MRLTFHMCLVTTVNSFWPKQSSLADILYSPPKPVEVKSSLHVMCWTAKGELWVDPHLKAAESEWEHGAGVGEACSEGPKLASLARSCQYAKIWLLYYTDLIAIKVLLSSLIQSEVRIGLEQTHRRIPSSISVIRGNGSVTWSIRARSTSSSKESSCSAHCRAENSRRVSRLMKERGKPRLHLKMGRCPQVKKPS